MKKEQYYLIEHVEKQKLNMKMLKKFLVAATNKKHCHKNVSQVFKYLNLVHVYKYNPQSETINSTQLSLFLKCISLVNSSIEFVLIENFDNPSAQKYVQCERPYLYNSIVCVLKKISIVRRDRHGTCENWLASNPPRLSLSLI